MTAEDKQYVARYLQALNFKDQEIFEEMFDHICSSFENREDEDQTIVQHLGRVIEPGFGGRKGIRKLRYSYAVRMNVLVLKQAYGLFLSYLFRWPTVLLTGVIVLLYFFLQRQYDSLNTFYYTQLFGALVPFILVHVGIRRFRWQCLKAKKPYTRSQVNSTIAGFSFSGFTIIALCTRLYNWLVYGGKYGVLDFFLQHPPVMMLANVLTVVYCLVCLQLFKEKFQLKLA